jgi:hypothetical protein
MVASRSLVTRSVGSRQGCRVWEAPIYLADEPVARHCEAGAPLQLQPPSDDQSKTEARDPVRLARLPRADESTEISSMARIGRRTGTRSEPRGRLVSICCGPGHLLSNLLLSHGRLLRGRLTGPQDACRCAGWFLTSEDEVRRRPWVAVPRPVGSRHVPTCVLQPVEGRSTRR